MANLEQRFMDQNVSADWNKPMRVWHHLSTFQLNTKSVPGLYGYGHRTDAHTPLHILKQPDFR